MAKKKDFDFKPKAAQTDFGNSNSGDMTVDYAMLTKKQKINAKKRSSVLSGLFESLHRGHSEPQLNIKVDQFAKRKGDCDLNVRDAKQLLFSAMGLCMPPKWASVKNKNGLPKVVLVTVDGLGEQGVRESPREFPLLAEAFSRVFSVTIPYNFYERLSILRFYDRCTQSSFGPRIRPKGPRKRAKLSGELLVQDFLASEEEMRENKFPARTHLADAAYSQFGPRPQPGLASAGDKRKMDGAPSKRRGSALGGFKKLKEGQSVDIVGIDCEMVLTAEGSELARCTVVDFDGNIVYDEYCRPEAEIIDFCTKYSGIDQKTMDATEKTLEDVQNDLKRIVFSDTVICGHSLENDLHALKIWHDRVVDSSLLFSHKNGLPWKLSLKFLAKKHLSLAIQQGEDGHNSAEDAAAVIDLVKLKFEKGFEFGNDAISFESLFSLVHRSKRKCAFVSNEKAIKLLTFREEHVSAHVAATVEEAVAKAEKALSPDSGNDFVWVTLGQKAAAGGDGLEDCSAREIDAALGAIFAHCPKNSFVMALSGDLMTQALKSKHSERAQWRKEKEGDWEGEKQYEKDIEMVKRGVCLVAIKK